MLPNAYFLANFRFDTAENEPAEKIYNLLSLHPRRLLLRGQGHRGAADGSPPSGRGSENGVWICSVNMNNHQEEPKTQTHFKKFINVVTVLHVFTRVYTFYTFLHVLRIKKHASTH